MSIKKTKFGLILSMVLSLLCFGNTPLIAMGQERVDSLASSLLKSKLSVNSGYRAITAFEDYFIAVGTDGRMDRINKSGEVFPIEHTFKANLNSVICDSERVIAVGEEGTILISTDGKKYSKLKCGTTENINCISSFKGILIAAAEHGTILLNKSGASWSSTKLSLKGDIVSISASTNLCVGVTNKGEIIKTSDGLNWSIFDYNAEYAGYSKKCLFKAVVVTENSIAVTGQHEDNTPVLLFSLAGNVWTERTLYYTDGQGKSNALTNLPNNICFDSINDQFFLACDNGEVFCLPACSKCNRSFAVTDKNLQGILCKDNRLILVGDNYFVHAINM
jgi:hypothetical protein